VRRLFGYLWALPVTCIGLFFALLAELTGGKLQVRGGTVEAHGGFLGRLLRGGKLFRGGAAMALGHVILARDQQCLDKSRPHERVHVRQYERWGPLLLPVHFLVSGWLAWRGYDPHLDHPFEQEAYEHDRRV
jgi:hypothetical protein